MLTNLRERLAHPDRALHACGAYLVGSSQRSFRDQSHGGVAWPERAVPNRAGVLEDLRAGRSPPERRWDARPAALDTGRLRSSIAYRLDGNKIVVGSRLSYASDVQLGASRVIELTADLRAALAAWLRKLSNREKRTRSQFGEWEKHTKASERNNAARAAFGPLFRIGVLRVTTPPRPFVGLTDQDRQAIRRIVAGYLGGKAA